MVPIKSKSSTLKVYIHNLTGVRKLQFKITKEQLEKARAMVKSSTHWEIVRGANAFRIKSDDFWGPVNVISVIKECDSSGNFTGQYLCNTSIKSYLGDTAWEEDLDEKAHEGLIQFFIRDLIQPTS